MKKICFEILAVLMLAGIVLFTGCGEQKAEKKVLLMATEPTFPPYEFYEKGKVVGIDADIVREVAEELGYRVEIIDMKFDSVVLAVANGKCDIGASGITITEERKAQIDFSLPYAEAGQVVVVPKDSKIANVEALKEEDVRLGVQRETTGDTFVTKNLHEPMRFDTMYQLQAALTAGDVDAIVCDLGPAKRFLAANPGMVILEKPLTKEEYAFVFSKDNRELMTRFNVKLRKMKESGRLQQIIAQYQGAKNK